MTESTKKITVMTLPVVAGRLGLHRTTVKRMEDRGYIPRAARLDDGVTRVYTEEDFKVIEKKVTEYRGSRKGGTLIVHADSLIRTKSK